MIQQAYVQSPTAQAFHADYAEYCRFIKGPVGGGKTSMAIMEMFFCGLRQQPDANNARRTRWVIIRNTFPELKSTVIKTFEEWLGHLTKVVYDSPIRAKINQPLPDGTTLDMEFWFIALDDSGSVKKLRSLEVTGGYISEASEIKYEVFEMLRSRLGRFPKVREGEFGKLYGPTWSGIIMESNPPSIKSWIYQMFEVDRPKGFRIYHQPPAMLHDAESGEYTPNPEAENIAYLMGGHDYYINQIRGAREEWIKTYIMGEYGTSYSGKPVWSDFSKTYHVAQSRLEPNGSAPIIVGMDFGLHPAAVFTQLQPGGRVAVLAECAPTDVTLEDFLAEHVMPIVQQRFAGRRVEVVGDPSGNSRSALANLNSFQTIRQAGLPASPAVTNDPLIRVGAVAWFLKRRGGFLIDPSCIDLIEAMAGGYRYAKRKSSSGDTEFKDKPEKNEASHIADACQYAMLFHRGLARPAPRAPLPVAKSFKYV
jgi:hypothetical protein